MGIDFGPGGPPVARYQAGEDQLLKFLIGQVMKETQGTADAALAKNILLVKLKS